MFGPFCRSDNILLFLSPLGREYGVLSRLSSCITIPEKENKNYSDKGEPFHIVVHLPVRERIESVPRPPPPALPQQQGTKPPLALRLMRNCHNRKLLFSSELLFKASLPPQFPPKT